MTFRTTIKARRTDRSGRQLLQIVCPACDQRHWVTSTATDVACPRRSKRISFTVNRGRAMTGPRRNPRPNYNNS
jgi:hypothetical protein